MTKVNKCYVCGKRGVPDRPNAKKLICSECYLAEAPRNDKEKGGKA